MGLVGSGNHNPPRALAGSEEEEEASGHQVKVGCSVNQAALVLLDSGKAARALSVVGSAVVGSAKAAAKVACSVALRWGLDKAHLHPGLVVVVVVLEALDNHQAAVDYLEEVVDLAKARLRPLVVSEGEVSGNHQAVVACSGAGQGVDLDKVQVALEDLVVVQALLGRRHHKHLPSVLDSRRHKHPLLDLVKAALKAPDLADLVSL